MRFLILNFFYNQLLQFTTATGSGLVGGGLTYTTTAAEGARLQVRLPVTTQLRRFFLGS